MSNRHPARWSPPTRPPRTGTSTLSSGDNYLDTHPRARPGHSPATNSRTAARFRDPSGPTGPLPPPTRAQLRASGPQVARPGHLPPSTRARLRASRIPKWPDRATSRPQLAHGCALPGPKWPDRATSRHQLAHSCALPDPQVARPGHSPAINSRTAARFRDPKWPDRATSRHQLAHSCALPGSKWPDRATSRHQPRAQLRASGIQSGPTGPPPAINSRTAARFRIQSGPTGPPPAINLAHSCALPGSQVARPGPLPPSTRAQLRASGIQSGPTGPLPPSTRAQLRASGSQVARPGPSRHQLAHSCALPDPKWPDRALSRHQLAHSCALPGSQVARPGHLPPSTRAQLRASGPGASAQSADRRQR